MAKVGITVPLDLRGPRLVTFLVRLTWLDHDDRRRHTDWFAVTGYDEYRPGGLPVRVQDAISGIVLDENGRYIQPHRIVFGQRRGTYIPPHRIVAVDWERVADDLAP